MMNTDVGRAGVGETTTGLLEPRQGTEALWPLDILLAMMRESWRDNRDKMALDCAKFAAPYVHARRKTASGRLNGDIAALTDEEIEDGLRR